MMKKYFLAIALSLSMSAFAQKQVMYISLNDGTTQTFNVSDIKEMTFGEEGSEQTPAEKLAGNYTGQNTLAVGTLATYTVDVNISITANEDGTVNFSYPQYDIPNTMMGNLTLGAVTISNIPYVEADGAFFLDYSDAGLKQHFTAVNAQGVTTMDNDYTLGATSSIKIEMTDEGIKVTNPFKLGAMPFPLTATYLGKKEIK